MERVAAGGEAPGRAGLLLRRALRAEVALIVVVLGVTGALAAYAPSIAAQSGPYSTSSTIGPTEFEMTVDPARVGANQIHLYLFDARSGAQFTRTKELDVTAAESDKNISLPLTPQLSGPGHYTIPDALLSVPGTWKIEVTLAYLRLRRVHEELRRAGQMIGAPLDSPAQAADDMGRGAVPQPRPGGVCQRGAA